MRGDGGAEPRGSGLARQRPGHDWFCGRAGRRRAPGGPSSWAGGEAGATKARAAGGPSAAPATSGSFAGRFFGQLRECESAERPNSLGDTSREAVSVKRARP